MQLAPVNPTATFVKVQPLPTQSGTAPTPQLVDWKDVPANDSGLVTVRYRGVDEHGGARVVTVRNTTDFTGAEWYSVQGSFDDAVSAARTLAVREGDVEQPGHYARTSVAVLEAADGWRLLPVAYSEGMGDGMDAIISMPIDRVGASESDVSVPYDANHGHGFDIPSQVQVRFDDPRVAALVGVDSIALAPKV